jgi:hypothetical protein
MGLRVLLVGLIVAATTAFVVGVSIERGHESSHHAAPGEVSQPSTNETDSGEGAATEAHAELRPLGVNVEAWPFVAAAAIASLALAAGAWLRPTWASLLALVAVAMLLFAALDIREVVHQGDIDENALAVLAGEVAALHLAASTLAAVMATRARGAARTPAGPTGTMAA